LPENPQPAWYRAWKRVETELKPETKADICSVAERLLTIYDGELTDAIFRRDYVAIDRLSDEVRNFFGRMTPLCPALARPVVRRIEKKLEEARRIREGGRGG